MVVKRGLPEEMSTLLKQLVMNGHIRMAGTVLHTYLMKKYELDEVTAAEWIVVYFRREFPRQLSRHQEKTARTN
ncbi:hypothetical protein [Cohnella soli]|uniref:Uncharacterized protein n=1 Tax=Cohnella soli TaxID=425005 RepID=A0ABW0HX32_9BACL